MEVLPHTLLRQIQFYPSEQRILIAKSRNLVKHMVAEVLSASEMSPFWGGKINLGFLTGESNVDLCCVPPVVERAMKVQGFILGAIEGRLKWYQAAEILGISDRQMHRWKQCYERGGCDWILTDAGSSPRPSGCPWRGCGRCLLCIENATFI